MARASSARGQRDFPAGSLSSLGIKGQESSDPLIGLFQRARPGQKLPPWVKCPARRLALKGRPQGLLRCKHLFCPHCHNESQRLLRKRIAKLLHTARDRGAAVSFVTLTAAHPAGAPLRHSATVVETAWRRTRTGSPWSRLKAQFGLLGVVSVIDVTYGVNGWHFHIHALVVTSSDGDAKDCAQALSDRYARMIAKSGLPVSDKTVHVRAVDDESGLADYFAKSWHIKQKDNSETPMHLLKRAFQGSDEAFMLFLEASDAFHQRHRGVVSPYLTRALDEFSCKRSR